MTLLRACAVVLALIVGGVLAALFAPVGWLAPQVAQRSANAATLTQVTGTLIRGGGVLQIPGAGITEPVRWRLVLPFTFALEIGGGELHATVRQTLAVVPPGTRALRHPIASAAITAQSDVQLTRLFSAPRLVGSVSAPALRLTLPATTAQFENVSLSVDAAGVISGSASGDATANLSGQLDGLHPPRGGATLTLALNGRNPVFDAGARRVMTAGANNQLTYVTRFQK